MMVSLTTEDLHKGLGLDNRLQGQISVTDIGNIRLALPWVPCLLGD